MNEEGDESSRAKSKKNPRSQKSEKVTVESDDDDANASSPSPAGPPSAEASLLVDIHSGIKAICSDVKDELLSFRSQLRGDARRKTTELRDEINPALGDIRGDLKNRTTRLEEAELCVAELEESNHDPEDSLQKIRHKHEHMQTKLTDLEAQSQQN